MAECYIYMYMQKISCGIGTKETFTYVHDEPIIDMLAIKDKL